MRHLLPVALLALAACSSDPAPVDGGPPRDDGPITVDVGGDLGAADTGADVSRLDVGEDRPAVVDVGADAGPMDSGAPDVGPADAGTIDAGATDAGQADASDAGADAASDVPADNGGTCTTVADCPARPNANPRCTAGYCRIDCFPDTRGDCDGNPANGCEVDSLTDPMNCGACRNACPASIPRCVNGACTAM